MVYEKQYDWKAGARINADAKKVGIELDQIEKKTPESILKIGKKKSTELHKCFDWEDSHAAHAYRLEQARRVLNSIVIVEVNSNELDDEEVVVYRAFENVSIGEEGEKERVYVSIQDALEQPDLKKQVMKRLKDGIDQLEHTAEIYEYLCDSFSDVRGHLKKAKETIFA